jgi:hypothetical protein
MIIGQTKAKCSAIVRVTDDRGVELCHKSAHFLLFPGGEPVVLCAAHAQELLNELKKDMKQWRS